MEKSFNCLVLGVETLNSLAAFSVNFYKEDNEIFTKLGNNRYDIEKFKVDHLKDYICDITNSDKQAMRLWRVNVTRDDIKVNVSTEEDIKDKLNGEVMEYSKLFKRYFQDKDEKFVENTHIIAIIPTAVLKTFPHIKSLSINQLVETLALIWDIEELERFSPNPQNDPCFKLKMEPSFFKINLPRGITKKTSKKVDLCLPSYDNSRMNNYHNPFYNDPQFIETVSLVQEKVEENPGDVIVLSGVSGGGKTSTAFGIAMQCWSIYIDFSPSAGTYGNHVGEELENIRVINPSFEHNDQQNQAFRMLDRVILSRELLLIKMLIEEKISTPKEWLFVQLQMDDYMIRQILSHKDYGSNGTFSTLLKIINSCLKVDYLTLILDEAQVLCRRDYGEYKGSSVSNKKWNLLQAYVEHLTILPVTCLIAGTYMHMASGISLVASVGKADSLNAHIVLKLPFLSQNDVLRCLDAVIDLTDVTTKTRNCLGHILKGRPRNCASFVRMLISERESKNRTKDQEIQELLFLWFERIRLDMAVYLENACMYPRANKFNPETAIMDVLRLRVFYDHKFEHAIKLLQHSIIPCQSPDYITLNSNNDSSHKIKINTSLESYLVSSIELFLLKRGKSLVNVFVDNIILLNNISSIGNELDAVFITAMIQKRGLNVRKELDQWKNGQVFDLPSWITSTMRFMTISNLSGSVPITEYIDNMTYYRSYGIQPDRFSGSDAVVAFADDEQNVVLLSASCTVSGEPIERSKIKEQVFKSCMKFQYMEKTRKRKREDFQIEDHEEEFSWKKEECLEVGLGEIPTNEGNNAKEEKEKKHNQDFNPDDDDDVNFDLNYIENTKGYHVSRVSKRAHYHEKIKSSTENRKHIYVSVELPHRASKERPDLFRLNDYGDLVIIVDDRNMEYVFGPVIKELVKRISYKENQEDLMDQTE
ncbi:hypothetical protein RclHR1_02260001 [Rhizophagus clarus]|uniref:Uncharacterized protein n=1 Tax=Rhizophagus clarus TaxID=94130 RepID=A0A2Z6RNV9_9GLOM|nr:hypothetical protein RclHR1_02260001 [Rhizophagus clarus]